MGDPLSITASLIAILQATSVAVGYFQGVRQAAKDIEGFTDELESLRGILTSLCDYASANPDSTMLQTFDTHLRGCLRDMTELHGKLAKGFSRRLRWPLVGKEYREYLDKIERLKSSISLAMDLDRDSRSKVIAILAERIEQGVENITVGRVQDSTLRQGEKRTEILIWLNPTGYDERHLEISNRRQSNTGEWLLKEAVVVDWVGGNSVIRLLWGYGIPGAGKTFLSSLMIDDLRSRAATTGWGVAFIYFNYNEQKQQTPTFFLSSLVKQFACQITDLPEQLHKLYERLHQEQKKPTFEELYSLLLAVIKPFTQAFIICDALDECEQYAQRTKLLPLFDRMGKDGMRLFLTSREYPEDIQHALQYASKIKLSAKNEDIAVYIERKIAENRRAESLVKQAKCKENIISMLQTCANGMYVAWADSCDLADVIRFLLVHFHIRYLCEQTTPRQLLDALKALKDSSSGESPMDPTYNRAMKIIHSQSDGCAELALKILIWLAKSEQVLTVRELQQAVSVEQHQTTFDELALPSEKTMLDVCASLVTIDQESNTVRLVHYTVKEYLVNNAIIPEDAEFRIVMACVTFLSYEGFSEGPSTERSLEVRYELYKMYPFLRYVDMHFDFHLQRCDEALSLDLVLGFLKGKQNVLPYLKACYLDEHEYIFDDLDYYDSILTLAACLGHTSVIQSLLKQGDDVSGDEDVREAAIGIAAGLGYNSIIEVLLENDAGVAPYILRRAITSGHVSTARLLIDKGASLSATDHDNIIPLHVAVDCYEEEIVLLLLEKGADVSATDKKGQTPLHIVAVEGFSEEIVRTLIEKGADVSATDNNGQTPLHIAAADSFGEEIVRILAEKGADVSATDKKGQTPLHIAASHTYGGVVRALLEKGADVLATDDEGQAPMHRANTLIAKILSEYQCDAWDREMDNWYVAFSSS